MLFCLGSGDSGNGGNSGDSCGDVGGGAIGGGTG